MNKVKDIVYSMTDAMLLQAVKELQQMHTTGILPEGAVRELARWIVSETGVSHDVALSLAQSEPLRRAAYKWAQLTEPTLNEEQHA